jgi:hypothetical protein
MVTLTNTTKVAKTFNIPCSPSCQEGRGKCLCSVVTTALAVELPDGTKGTKELTRRLPGSLTIRGGESLPVEDWVARAPSITRAVASKAIRLVRQ